MKSWTYRILLTLGFAFGQLANYANPHNELWVKLLITGVCLTVWGFFMFMAEIS